MKKILKKVGIVGLTGLPFLTLVSQVLADTELDLTPAGDFARLSSFSLSALASSLVSLALVLAALFAFGFLIFGGIIWISSGGDKAKTEQARNTITAALVGLLIVFGSWAIMSLLEAFFGVSLLTVNITPVSVTTGS